MRLKKELTIPDFLDSRFFWFLVLGGTAAIVNVLLMIAFVRILEWDTLVLRNLANVVSTELSLLYSFVVYRRFVWKGKVGGSFQQSIPNQLGRYHLSAGFAIATRAILLFPVLDYLRVNYAVNTLIGAGLGCVINFVLSNRYVFATNHG